MVSSERYIILLMNYLLDALRSHMVPCDPLAVGGGRWGGGEALLESPRVH